MKSDLSYYVSFSHFLGVGPIKLKRLVSRFGDIRSAYYAPVSDIQGVIGQKTGSEFDAFRKSFQPEKTLNDIQTKNMHVLSWSDPSYPCLLKEMHDPPICLYVKGNVESYDLTRTSHMSIVGSRKTTSYGKSIARSLSRELSESGWSIVSGMALGIDAEAHKGALEAEGATIAVLGCGVNIVYPEEHRFLYHDIITKGGLILSEFPPDMYVRKGYFVTRNRIIAGLSQGCIVVEGKKSSGALITARCAAEMGRDVFACPGLVTSALSEGPHKLIHQGAKLVSCTQDVLDEYNQMQKKQNTKNLEGFLEKEELELYEILLNENTNIDLICKAMRKQVYEVSLLISSLELKGCVKMSPSGDYEVCMG
jgi:DNA processing protein